MIGNHRVENTYDGDREYQEESVESHMGPRLGPLLILLDCARFGFAFARSPRAVSPIRFATASGRFRAPSAEPG
jgi:hypothetical protein